MNARYHYCPQLKIYDHIGFKWIPHLMFMNNPNFRSEECNTDIYGLRFNSKKFLSTEQKSIFDQKIDKKKSLMVGSSTTFGVGATTDEKTIPAILSDKSDNFFFNFGGRAFNGFQEFVLTELMINKTNNIDKILLYSGMNDVYMSYNESFISSFPGPFYFNSNFLNNMEDSTLNLNRKLLKFFLPNLDIDYKNVTKKDLIIHLFSNKKNIKNNKKTFFPKIDLDEIVSRNIRLWKVFSKSLNIEITFFLPPFLPWCKSEKNFTKEEEEINSYIKSTKEAKNTTYFEIMENDYKKIVSLFKDNCEKNEIKFFDCNSLFQLKENNNKWLFVDKVHLTDYGNELISNFILDKI